MISQPWFNHQWHQRIELAGKSSTGFNVVIILPQNFYLISSSHGPTFTYSTKNKDIIFFSVFLVSCILSICLWIDLHLKGNRGKNHKIYRPQDVHVPETQNMQQEHYSRHCSLHKTVWSNWQTKASILIIYKELNLVCFTSLVNNTTQLQT